MEDDHYVDTVFSELRKIVQIETRKLARYGNPKPAPYIANKRHIMNSCLVADIGLKLGRGRALNFINQINRIGTLLQCFKITPTKITYEYRSHISGNSLQDILEHQGTQFGLCMVLIPDAAPRNMYDQVKEVGRVNNIRTQIAMEDTVTVISREFDTRRAANLTMQLLKKALNMEIMPIVEGILKQEAKCRQANFEKGDGSQPNQKRDNHGYNQSRDGYYQGRGGYDQRRGDGFTPGGQNYRPGSSRFNFDEFNDFFRNQKPQPPPPKAPPAAVKEVELSPATGKYTDEDAGENNRIIELGKAGKWWDLLELRNNDKEGVKKEYRRLALKIHPDRNKAPGANEAMQFLQKAKAFCSPG